MSGFVVPHYSFAFIWYRREFAFCNYSPPIYMYVVWYNSVRAGISVFVAASLIFVIFERLFEKPFQFIYGVYTNIRSCTIWLIWFNLSQSSQFSFDSIWFNQVHFIHEIDRTNFTCRICQYKLYCTVNSVRNVFYIYSNSNIHILPRK